MGGITPNSNVTSLALHIRDKIFRDFKQNRENICEPKWQRNLDGFNMVSTDFWKTEETEGWRSNTFIPLIKMKVIAAWSIITDMLLMDNKIPFDLILAPWDDLTLEDLEEDMREVIKAEIHAMRKTIEQQFEDCHADRELMKIVLSDAIYGECLSRWYVHEVSRKGYRKVGMAPEGYEDQQGQYTRFEAYEITKNAPGWEYLSVWDCYRDLETDDLQKGVGFIVRQLWSTYDLAQKKGRMYYLDDGIETAIKCAPTDGNGLDKTGLAPGMRALSNRAKTVEVLEFWGRVPAKIVADFEATLKDGDKGPAPTAYENDGDEIEIMAMVAGDEVIRYARNEPGHRPFYRSLWEISLDQPAGTGVADNLEGIQLVLNGMIRAFEDNKKLSGNVMTIVNDAAVGDWDGILKPGLKISASDTVDDVRKAIQQFIIQDVGDSLLSGIALYERYGDDASQMPKIMQGATLDKRKPDTFSEMNMLMQNAGKYIGGVIKNLDEGTLEPVTQDFFDYNMEDPDVERGKGNFIAKSLGFASYQERVVRLNKIMQAMNIAMATPEMAKEVKMGDILKLVYDALDVDSAKVLKSGKEKAEELEAMANSPARKIEEQIMALNLETAQLKNDLARAQIAKTEAETQSIQDGDTLEGIKTGADLEMKRQAANKPEKGKGGSNAGAGQ